MSFSMPNATTTQPQTAVAGEKRGGTRPRSIALRSSGAFSAFRERGMYALTTTGRLFFTSQVKFHHDGAVLTIRFDQIR